MTDNAWTDDALVSGDRDTLGRRAYAKRAAELVVSRAGSDGGSHSTEG
ncbi:hypothetical protein [Nocardioides furvisabuli]|nr:hypothetical protein [Nocardioides furvisabuli]